MADFIDGLDPNTPRSNDPVRLAAAEVRGIKTSLLGTFPTYSEALDIGPIEINVIEARIVALESTFTVTARKIASGFIDMNDEIATYTVTGLGFTPSLVIFSGNSTGGVQGTGSANASFGFGDGTQQHCLSYASDGNERAGNDVALASSEFLFRLFGAQGSVAPNDETLHGVLTSLDTDGFTVDQTKAQPTSLSNRFLWTAFE